MQQMIDPEYGQVENAFPGLQRIFVWVFALLLIKVLELISKIDEDCFV
jgi:hypothetical protein